MVYLQPLPKTVPLSSFNRGKASKIFSDVKKYGTTVVMKNNEPECVLLSPNDYNALLERLCNAESLYVAEKETLPKEDIEANDENNGEEFDRGCSA